MSDNGGEPPAEAQGHMPSDAQGVSDGADEKFKIFIRGQGVGTTLDKAAVESTFSRFGEIKSVWAAGGGRGYCFVEYARREDAETAIREMNNQEISGVRIDVEMARRTTPGGRAGGEFGAKPGDWSCPGCRVNNFARRDRCFRCGTPKPFGGGGGGWDRDDRRRGRARSRDDRRPPYDDRRGGYEDRRGGYDDRRGGGGGGYDERRGGAPPGAGAGGYDRGGYDRGGYDRGGYDRGYDRGGVDDRRGAGPPAPAAPRYEERGRGRSKSR